MWVRGKAEMMAASLFYKQKGTAFDSLKNKKRI